MAILWRFSTMRGGTQPPPKNCGFFADCGFQFTWPECTTGIYLPGAESCTLVCVRLPHPPRQCLSVISVPFPRVGVILLFALGTLNAFAAPPQMVSSPSILRFGNVDVGQTETLMVSLTNTQLTSVTITGVTVSDPSFGTPNLTLPLVIGASQSVEVSISFTPATTGWVPGTIDFTSNAYNSSLSMQAGGTGVNSQAVTGSPSTLSFGQVAVGSSASLPLVITNARSWAVTISAIQTTGSAFSVSGITFPLTLSAGQSVTLTVTYLPTSAGLIGGSILFIGPRLCIPITGTGTSSGSGQLSLIPASLKFGNVTVGTTASLPVALYAAGASVTISSDSSTSSQFALTGVTLPVTLTPGESLSVNVAFTPQSSSTVTGSISFSSNASNSPGIESLNGVGTAATYSVNLIWNASSDVTGYNVYRSTSSSGSYSKINSALDANTAYTDTSVASGNTYYYAATSVNSSGQESSLSTPPVQAVVP
jgi:Abnormal spindle-like microcephaly-assoc'd, ASPM-SPD-2-Hydin